MDASEIRWNEPARAKILDDADRVLREAVLEVAASGTDVTSDDAFAELNARLKDRFIDYEPGPDIRTYADAIAAGEFAEAPRAEEPSGDEPGTADEQATEEGTPSTEELEEPSTEKEPGEEPKGGASEPEPSHEAVGIGVIGAPLVDPEQGGDTD